MNKEDIEKLSPKEIASLVVGWAKTNKDRSVVISVIDNSLADPEEQFVQELKVEQGIEVTAFYPLASKYYEPYKLALEFIQMKKKYWEEKYKAKASKNPHKA